MPKIFTIGFSGKSPDVFIDVLRAVRVSAVDRICLLCTEKSSLQCHRRLAAEYIAAQLPGTDIIHL